MVKADVDASPRWAREHRAVNIMNDVQYLYCFFSGTSDAPRVADGNSTSSAHTLPRRSNPRPRDGIAAALLLDIHGADLDAERLRSRAEEEDVADALVTLRALLSEGGPLTEDRLAAVHDNLERR